MLVVTTEIVRKKSRQERTLDQIKTEGLPEEWKTWGTGFVKQDFWLETIFTSLTRKPKP